MKLILSATVREGGLVALVIACLVSGVAMGDSLSTKSGCGKGKCEPEHGEFNSTTTENVPLDPHAWATGTPPEPGKEWVPWDLLPPGYGRFSTPEFRVVKVTLHPLNPTTQYRTETTVYHFSLPRGLWSATDEQVLEKLADRCGRREKSESVATGDYRAGSATVSPPQVSNGIPGCGSCGFEDEEVPTRFKVEINLGAATAGMAALTGSAAGQIVFQGDLASADFLKLANFDVLGGGGSVTGTISSGTVTVRDLESNEVVTTATASTTTSGGKLQTVTIVVTPAVGEVTTHLFQRIISGVHEGVRYTLKEGSETSTDWEVVEFYNTGTTLSEGASVSGIFKMVNVDGSVETWNMPAEDSVIEWNAVNHRFDGELVHSHERVPAGAGQPKVETVSTYKRIGDETNNVLVLLSETVTRVLGSTTLSTETTLHGYDEVVYHSISSFNPEGTLNTRLGQRLWTVAPDKSWKLEMAEEIPTLIEYGYYDEELEQLVNVWEMGFLYGDIQTYTPWLDGPAPSGDISTRVGADAFFAGLTSEARSNGFKIAGCRRSHAQNKMPYSVAWKEKRTLLIGDLTHGVEYDYERAMSSLSLGAGLGTFGVGDRHERWNAVETAVSWRASGTGGTGRNAVIDHTGVATLSTTDSQGDGTVTDSWKVTTTASGGYGSGNYRSLPNYTVAGDFPLWSSVEYDDKGREVKAESKVRAEDEENEMQDYVVQTITTAYSGETGRTRSSGGAVLEVQGEDVVASGQRTSTRTDAQGITTTTVTNEATGEMVSATKEGVAASGGHAAQPDVTTSYARSTNNTTGVTTQTVTQSDGTTTRTLSVTVTDALGRTTSVTDEIGRVTSYSYSNFGRTATETLPGSLTRITESYLDGQVRRVYGTAVMAEYHTYVVNAGGGGYEAGSITETVYSNDDGTGGIRSTHWRKTTTNYLGQVLREEEPSPATGTIVTEHFYDAKGQRVKTTRTGMADQLAHYDDFGRVVKQGYDVNEDGALTAVSADILTEMLTDYEEVSGRWVEKTTQRVHTKADGTDALDTVTRRGLAEGASSWQSTTGPDGSVTVYESTADAEDHLRVETVSRSAPGVGTLTVVQTRTAYNGLLVAQSVPDASTAMTFGYNGFGQMTSQVHPVAGTSTWTYNATTGQQETQTAAGSSTVTTTYYGSSHANAGQVATVTANGEVTRYGYDAQGHKTHQWGTGSQPLKYVYDGLGRLYQLHTYQGGTGWDGSTLPAAFGSATPAVTTWDYRTGTNALWKKTDAATKHVEYAYGTSGLLSTKTNARGITTTYSHAQTTGGKKLPGRVTGLNYSDSTPDVTMTYYRSGEVETVTDAAGLSTFARSGATRTTAITGSGLMTGLDLNRTEFGPDMPETVQAQVGGATFVLNQHQWNGNGSLAKAWQGHRSTGAGGTGIRHVWNRSGTTGRLQSITTEALGSGATHGITRGYTHTAGGRVEKIWYNAGTLGSANTSIQGFDYAHDAHGRRETVAPYLPDAAPATSEQPPGWKYGYNERGEVEVADRFTAAGGPSTGVVTHQRRSYDYDLMGNRNTATQGTNVGELNETGYTANILQQYDGISHTRQVEITGQAVAGAVVELTLDAGTPFTVNRSLAAHKTGDPDSFRYVHTMSGTDARWLHVSIKASSGGIDIVRAGFVYVPPASEALDYDEDGNLTETAQWDYAWDAENRLIKVEQKSLPVASGLTAPSRKKLEFAYDVYKRRIAKVAYEWKTVGGTPQWALTKDLRFVYDGWQMLAELDHTFATGTGLAGSAVNRTFLWGPDLSGSMTGAGGVGGLLSTTYQGITYQVCSDANGNITGLVPVSGTGAGALVARFDYDPFGNQLTNAGPNVELCPFGFSSKYLDRESEIVSFELRGYLPMLGKWLNRDPIAENGGINLYGMVGNDPVNQIDILGLATFEIVLKRNVTGNFAVYGELSASLKLTRAEEEQFECCKALVPLKFMTMETVGKPLKSVGTYTPYTSPENSWANGTGANGTGFPKNEDNEFIGGFTSIRGKLEFMTMMRWISPGEGSLPQRPSNMSQSDYDDVVNQEFHPQVNNKDDGRNIHFGPTANHSTGCVLIGTSYIYVISPFDGDRFGLAAKNGAGTRYRVPGFGLQDTIDSQFKLLSAVQCAKRQGAKVQYKILNQPPPIDPDAQAMPHKDNVPNAPPRAFPLNF